MNDKQVQSHIRHEKYKIKSWQEEWQMVSDAGGSKEVLKYLDLRIKTIESSLSDFMDVLDNG